MIGKQRLDCRRLRVALDLCVIVTALALMSPSIVAQNVSFQVVHEFGVPGDGAFLYSGVTFDRAGNMYGASAGGGLHARGTVYEISPDGRGGWTENVLYSFGAPQSGDGAGPYGGVLVGAGEILYGTTSEAGQYGLGTAFSLTPGSGGWTETILRSFGRSDPIAGPASSFVQDSAGNLYGEGFFELSPGAQGWTLNVLCQPSPNVCTGSAFTGNTLAPNGSLFASGRGGKYFVGNVYQVEKTQSGWQAVALYDFRSTGGDGQIPSGGPLVADHAGNIFGTTLQGGRNQCGQVGCGAIYKLTRGANGEWTEMVIWNFQVPAKNTGYNPASGVVFDKYGSLYGSAGGGAYGCGVTYRLTPSKSGTWTYSVLHDFDCNDGVNPLGTLAFDANGNLFGATFAGGTNNGGEIYEISRK